MKPGDLIRVTYPTRIFRKWDYDARSDDVVVHIAYPAHIALVLAAVRWCDDDIRLLILCEQRIGWRSARQFKVIDNETG